ncbi:MAG: beta-ketoacyl-[acyl-carrier-protein] synthase family protein [Chitinispirillaceae bacterium]|nr:beta-ketoacyl-[acyl-carrier-protein] synthase family protein [Chitinispirillaceae bacterium]
MGEVWITGAGAVSALGDSIEEHRDAVMHKRSGLAPHEFFGGDLPDPCICGLVSDEVTGGLIDDTAVDRANRILSHAMKQALQSAGLAPGDEVDAIVGTTLGNMHGGSMYYRKVHAGERGDISLLKHFLPCSPLKSVCAEYGLRGFNMTVSSACGSAAAAIGQAVKRIRSGRTVRAVAGGFDTLSPYVVAGFNSLRLVSRNPCRPFDSTRDGLNPGEAAVLFVIESSETALRRGATPLAKIDGFGDNLEAYHYTRSHPEGDGMAAALRKAIADANITVDAISHIHLHGTGTEANDRSEYMACKKVFGDNLSTIPVCSTKSMTGHSFGGAAALSLLFTIFSLENGMVPATLNCDNPDKEFANLIVSSEIQGLSSIDRVASMALGFGGEAFALIASRVEAA